jgi:hypothetical protein
MRFAVFAAIAFSLSQPAFANPVDELVAKHQQIRLDGLTKCLQDGIKALNANREWDNDACYANIMTFEEKTDDFDDTRSLFSRVAATDASGNIYPIYLSVNCTDKSILVSVMTKHAYSGEKSAPFQYRIGKRPAKSFDSYQYFVNGYVSFGLMPPDEITFVQDLANGNNEDVLVRIKANDLTTFTAKFDAQNMAETAADALRVCPELQKAQ